MKNLPSFHVSVSALVVLSLTLMFASSSDVAAQSFPDPVPTADGGQIIHTVLRSGDPNVLLTKKQDEKGRPDQKGKRPHPPQQKKGKRPDDAKGKKDDRPAPVAKKSDCPECKKAGGPCEKCKKGNVAKKSDCPECKKAGGACEKCKKGDVAKKSDCPECKKAGGPCEKCKKGNVAKKSDCPECKKAGGPCEKCKKGDVAKKSDCPECKKADGPCEKCKKGGPPVAQGRGKGPHHPNDHFKHPLTRRADARSGNERAEEMRKRFEEMRKHKGGSFWGRRDNNDQVPHHLQPHTHTHPHSHPPVAGHPQQGNHPEIRELQELLERTQGELEKTRDSLSMAHKALGDRSLMVKKLQDSIKNYQMQLARAEEMGKQRAGNENGDVKKLAAALAEEKRKNEALQNDVKVVKKKAEEAVSQIQANAERHVKAEFAKAQKAMAEARAMADKLRAVAASRQQSPSAPPQSRGPARNSESDKPSDRKKSTERSPKKPEPNKPASGLLKGIAPIEFKLKSAVDYEARDRVLADAKALLKSSPDAKIKIIGHADDSPYEQVNKDISSNRAGFLASYLRVNGIPAGKITHEGIGNTAPAKGAENNRRVVFEVTQ